MFISTWNKVCFSFLGLCCDDDLSLAPYDFSNERFLPWLLLLLLASNESSIEKIKQLNLPSKSSSSYLGFLEVFTCLDFLCY